MIGHPAYYICAINIFSCGVMFLYVVQNLLTIHAYTTRVINNYFDALFIGQLCLYHSFWEFTSLFSETTKSEVTSSAICF